jgi:ribose transport system substrate-binding protein
MALGALKAVEGAKKNVVIVGFDGQKDALASIENGGLSATIAQHPIDEGFLGVEAAVKAIKGESVDKRIDTGTEVITKENVKEFQEKIKNQMGG